VLPAPGSYLAPVVRLSQAELAAQYRPEVHTEVVPSSSPLAREATGSIHPTLLLPQMPELFLTPAPRESPRDFRDRFLVEAFVPYVLGRWWTVDQLVQDVMRGRYEPVLQAALEDAVEKPTSAAGGSDVPASASAAGSGDLSVRWMASSVSQLFPGGGSASEYVRASLRDSMWRVYRRTRAVFSSAGDVFEYKFVKLPPEQTDRFYPPVTAAKEAPTTESSDEQARKRARVGPPSPPSLNAAAASAGVPRDRDEHKSAVNHSRDAALASAVKKEATDAQMSDVPPLERDGASESSGALRARVAKLERELASLRSDLTAARASSTAMCVRCRHRPASVVLLRCGHTSWCETCTLHYIHKNSKRVLATLRAGAFLSLQPHEVLQCPLDFCKTNNSSIIRPLQRPPEPVTTPPRI